METCQQQIVWHLKKQDLERILEEGRSRYTALEIKMCVLNNSDIVYLVRLITVNPHADQCDGVIIGSSSQVKVCPVPPDCNISPDSFKKIIREYYLDDKLNTLNKAEFLETFR